MTPVFSLSCDICDAGTSIMSAEQAVLEGWTKPYYDDGLSWTYLATCPKCQVEDEEDHRQVEERNKQLRKALKNEQRQRRKQP